MTVGPCHLVFFPSLRACSTKGHSLFLQSFSKRVRSLAIWRFIFFKMSALRDSLQIFILKVRMLNWIMTGRGLLSSLVRPTLCTVSTRNPILLFSSSAIWLSILRTSCLTSSFSFSGRLIFCYIFPHLRFFLSSRPFFYPAFSLYPLFL